MALVPDGARTLLQTRLMERLSELTAIDCWPHRSASAGVVERYRLVARPALRLCLCVLAALGRENQSAVAQVGSACRPAVRKADSVDAELSGSDIWS